MNKIIIINFLSTAISSIITFFSSAYFSRMIQPSNYGQLAIASTLAAMFSTILSLQVVSSVGPSINKFGIKFKNEYRLTISIFSTLAYLFFTLILLFLNKLFYVYLNLNIELLVFALSYGYGLYMVNIYITSNNFDFKPNINFIVKITIAALTFTVSVIFIYLFNENNNLLAREIGLGGIYLVFGLFVVTNLLVKNNFLFPKRFVDYLKFCLPFTVPLIFNYIVNDALQLTDKLMIKYILNIEQVGIYSLAVSFATTCLVIVTIFENSYTPFFYKKLDENNLKALEKHTNYYIELFTVISCGFILLSKEVFGLYADKKYIDGVVILPIIVLNYYFVFLNLITLNYQFYNKKSQYITITSIIALALNLVFNYLLINIYGIMGAAIASLMSRIIIFILNHIFAKYKISKSYIFNLFFYFKWCLIAFVIVLFFYETINFTLLRWITGFIIGVFEIIRIFKRKSIF